MMLKSQRKLSHSDSFLLNDKRMREFEEDRLSRTQPQPQANHTTQQSYSDSQANRVLQSLLSNQVNIDKVIQVILSDEKLFQFVMRLVTQQITRQQEQLKSSSSQRHKAFPRNQEQLNEIIDQSIEEALSQIRLIDMITSLLQNPPPSLRQSSDPSSSISRSQINEDSNQERITSKKTDQSARIEVSEESKRYNYSNKIFINVDPNENNPPPSHHREDHEPPMKPPSYSEREPEQPGSLQTVKKTVQALNKHQKPPLGHSSSTVPPAHPVPAATKTQQSRHNHIPSNQAAGNNNGLFISTDVRQDFSVGDSERNSFLSVDSLRDSEASTVQITLPLDKSLTDKSLGALNQPVFDDSFEEREALTSEDVKKQRSDSQSLINQSFQVTSELNSVQNSMEIPNFGRKGDDNQDKERDEDKYDEEDDDDNVDVDETVKEWGRKVFEKLKDEHQQPDDDEFFQLSGQLDHQVLQEEEFNQEEKDIKHSEDPDVSRRYDDESFEEDHDQPPASPRKPSTNSFPSAMDYLSSNYDPLQKGEGGGLVGGSKIMFFDQAQFDADVDAAQSGKKPSKKERIQFVDGVVSDVVYYERASADEAKEMYYSHVELDRFDMHYRKEDAIAERMGLSWMEWKNQQPDDFEISFSDDEEDDRDRRFEHGYSDDYEDDYQEDSYQF